MAIIWTLSWQLYLIQDFKAASSLLSLSINAFNTETFENLLVHDQFLRVVLQFMLDSDPVIRKRGAYILQTVSVYLSTKNSLKYDDNESKLSPDLTNKTISCTQTTFIDFLTAYQQIEGSSSLHLLEQVFC
jgi:hypothetical protein